MKRIYAVLSAAAIVLIVVAAAVNWLLSRGGAIERAESEAKISGLEKQGAQSQAQITQDALREADVTLAAIDRTLTILREEQTRLARLRPINLGASHAVDAPDQSDFSELYAAFADADERLLHVSDAASASDPNASDDPGAGWLADVRPGRAA